MIQCGEVVQWKCTGEWRTESAKKKKDNARWTYRAVQGVDGGRSDDVKRKNTWKSEENWVMVVECPWESQDRLRGGYQQASVGRRRR